MIREKKKEKEVQEDNVVCMDEAVGKAFSEEGILEQSQDPSG